MTKAENSRVAQSNEPSADRIAADLSLAGELARMTALFQQRAIVTHMGFKPDTVSGAASLAPVGGDDTSRVAPVNCAHCGEPAPHCQHSDALFAGVIA